MQPQLGRRGGGEGGGECSHIGVWDFAPEQSTCTVAAKIKVTFRFCATVVALRYGFQFGFVRALSHEINTLLLH